MAADPHSCSRTLVKPESINRILKSLAVFAFPLLSSTTLATIPHASPISPLTIAIAPDNSLIAVGEASTPSLVFVEPSGGGLRGKIPLHGRPEGLLWSPDGKFLYVSEAGAGTIVEVNPSAAQVLRRMKTGRYPAGLALSTNRGLLLACDRGLDRLDIIDRNEGKTLAHVATGRQPAFLAVTPDESTVLVSNLTPATAATAPNHATEITLIDLDARAVRASVRLPTGSTNARGIVLDRSGKTAYVAHTIGRFHLPTTQLDRGWVNTNALTIIDVGSATRVATVLLDQVMEGAADPWGVAVSPDGASLFITLSGVHQLAAIDLLGLHAMTNDDPDSFTNDLSALRRRGLLRRIDLPLRGPRGLDISADGKILAAAGYFSGNVAVMATSDIVPIALSLGPLPEPDEVRRGETAFFDANRCYQHWLSCGTCHADARVDGLNWDLLNDGLGNPKNARSMLLSYATPPVMSLGIRSDMETAVGKGFIHIQFTRPEPGEVEAVSAYLRSLRPEMSPYRMPDGSLSEAAKRGQQIFHRNSVGCADCHSGPHFTNLKLKDVGTASLNDRGKTAYDVPTLVELWRTPPYLHDGRAATVREVLVQQNREDWHGNTSGLESSEIDDLVEYLLSL